MLIDQRLADAALEAIELRLDDCEANLHEGLHSDDPRRRDAISMFFLRNTQRAAKRGYAVAASAASLEVGFGDRAQPQHITISWGDDDSARETDVIERDGKNISVPRYDDGRGDDSLEGEVATPAALIEHDLSRQLLPSRLPLSRRCLCGQVPIAAAVGPHLYRPMRRRRELRRHALDDDCRREAHRPRGRPRPSNKD